MIYDVYLLQPLVHDARPSYVGETSRAPVTVSIASLPSETKVIPLFHKTRHSHGERNKGNIANDTRAHYQPDSAHYCITPGRIVLLVSDLARDRLIPRY